MLYYNQGKGKKTKSFQVPTLYQKAVTKSSKNIYSLICCKRFNKTIYRKNSIKVTKLGQCDYKIIAVVLPAVCQYSEEKLTD